jgi:hypothetical protein
MRAGTAEGSLGGSKPGSPLAPLSLPRVSNSAEGVRSSSMNVRNGSSSPGGAASPSPGRMLQQQQQQMRPSREYQQAVSGSMRAAAGVASGRAAAWDAAEAAAAAGAGSPGRAVDTTQLSMQRQQQQQQFGGRQQMLATADEGGSPTVRQRAEKLQDMLICCWQSHWPRWLLDSCQHGSSSCTGSIIYDGVQCLPGMMKRAVISCADAL